MISFNQTDIPLTNNHPFCGGMKISVVGITEHIKTYDTTALGQVIIIRKEVKATDVVTFQQVGTGTGSVYNLKID